MSTRREPLSTAAFAATVVGAPLVVVLAGLAAVAHRISLEDDGGTAETVARTLGAAAAIVAVIVLSVRSVDRQRRRRRLRRRQDAIDELTGLPAAPEIDRWTGSLLASDAYDHHTVAVVRIEQLDLVAAVYGDAMRDRVIVDVANRLRAGVGWLTGARTDATATLLASGPGEFVVSLHARTPIDLDLVQRVLTLRSGRVLVFGTERVPLTWTVGFGTVRDGADVEAIVAEARTESYVARSAPHSPPVAPDAPLRFERVA